MCAYFGPSLALKIFGQSFLTCPYSMLAYMFFQTITRDGHLH
ncbi:hypothetical protein BY454_105109 [Marinobacter persicus]|uniref:Uncharacterized protein n=1 Tax=Marinobacter persicus TaxID=930118 RepID=A0A2S6G829_9GAMM|nr:hypothetical protein BY455_106109 [Marinobacter persicus]PPK55345.1 hypothetical protein B0H24_1006109 [Marinobacter persicus]PPK59112.1 hypothetical protein BY454_105109 [Marinobacter persicus]